MNDKIKIKKENETKNRKKITQPFLKFFFFVQYKDYRTSDLHEMIRLSDVLLLLTKAPPSGLITDTWSRGDTIPWEMSIVVSCGALFWWKYLSEWQRQSNDNKTKIKIIRKEKPCCG